MSIDLRIEQKSGSWVRRFGEHETAGIEIAVNDVSAHVTLTEVGILFEIDRHDMPSGWEPSIDPIALRSELLATIVRQMSVSLLEELLGEIRRQRGSAFRDGDRAAKSKIREALGL